MKGRTNENLSALLDYLKGLCDTLGTVETTPIGPYMVMRLAKATNFGRYKDILRQQECVFNDYKPLADTIMNANGIEYNDLQFGDRPLPDMPVIDKVEAKHVKAVSLSIKKYINQLIDDLGRFDFSP